MGAYIKEKLAVRGGGSLSGFHGTVRALPRIRPPGSPAVSPWCCRWVVHFGAPSVANLLRK